MGNWMTVNIIGTCAPAEVRALRDACFAGDDWGNFHPLCWFKQPSVCGLGQWPAESMNISGNLAERGYR
jgi:hypothetical protein